MTDRQLFRVRLRHAALKLSYDEILALDASEAIVIARASAERVSAIPGENWEVVEAEAQTVPEAVTW
jgi:hypothetical protein